MEKIIIVYEEKFKKWGVYVISAPLIVMTIIEVLNAIGRKLFLPFPCTIEAVESLLVISVYFGVSIVALEGGHVNVTLATERFPESVKHFLDAMANFLGALTFGYLAAGAWGEAYKSFGILEMRIGVYRFPLWPFKILFAVGLTFLTIQLVFNAIKIIHLSLGHTSYAGMDKVEKPEAYLEM